MTNMAEFSHPFRGGFIIGGFAAGRAIDGLWPEATCNGAAGMFRCSKSLSRLKGLISPERYAHLEITNTRLVANEFEKYAKHELGHALKKQVIMLDTFKHWESCFN